MLSANFLSPRRSPNGAIWTAGALFFLPLALLAPADWDRFLPLLLLPALLAYLCVPMGTAPAWRQNPLFRLWIWAGIAFVISTVLSDQTPRALVTGSAWILVVMGGFAIRPFLREERNRKWILISMAGGPLIGLILVRSLAEPDGWPIPVYGHPRIMGMHLMSGAWATLMLLFQDRPRTIPAQIGRRALAGLLCGGVWWAGGRAPLLGILAGLATWFFIADRKLRIRILRQLPAVGAIAWVVAFGLGGGVPGTGWTFPFTRTLQAKTLDQVTSARLEVWQTARAAIAESPWTGHGADSYVFIRPRQPGDQPHNAIIQWLLDFGVFGALPLSLILLRIIARGLRAPNPDDEWRRAASAGLVAASVAGMFDGVFYHAVAFMPVAIFGGMACGSVTTARQSAIGTAKGALVAACVSVLLVHQWLVAQLAYGLPASPDALAPRVLRLFPSQTYPLTRWLEYWSMADPEASLAWSRWAEPHAISPAFLHAFNAEYYAGRGLLPAARGELETALSQCRAEERAGLKHELDKLDSSPAADGAKSPPQGK